MGDPALPSAASRSYCTFHADQRLYGIDVTSLREISTHLAITPVPLAPPIVRGVTNLRSRILLILDLRALLGLPAIPTTGDTRLIILKPGVSEDLGLLVDRGGNIVTVAPDRIEPTEQGEGAGVVSDVCKLDDGLLMIIDARRLAAIVAGQLHDSHKDAQARGTV